MIRVRRTPPEVRLELTPLIDVVFLLLTFFIFALVLMVPADVLGISLPSLGSADAAQGTKVISIALDADGGVRVQGEAVSIDGFVDAVRAEQSRNAQAPVLIAADTAGRAGALLEVIDRLMKAGITDFALVGQRDESR